MPNPLIIKKVLATSGNKYGAYTSAFYTKVLAEGGSLTPTELTAFTTFENVVGSDLSEFDRLWFHGLSNQIAARISFVNPNSTLITEVKVPTWTAYQGYTGNGSTSYLDTNFNPALNGVKYIRDNASFGLYSRTNSAIAAYDFDSSLACKWNDLNHYMQVNSFVSTIGTEINSLGLYSCVRTGANNTAIYRNSILNQSDTSVSVGLVNYNLYLFCRNVAGNPLNFSSRQYSLSFIGSGAVNQSTLYTAIQALGTTLGWAV